MGAIRGRINEWWLRLPEPRELSSVYTIIYSIAMITGVVTLLFPPRSLAAEVGETAMSSVGALLIAGAIIGMVGGAVEHSKLERIGLSLQAWALLIYAVIVTILHFTSPGSRLTQLGVIALALLGSYVVRWLLIWRRDRHVRG